MSKTLFYAMNVSDYVVYAVKELDCIPFCAINRLHCIHFYGIICYIFDIVQNVKYAMR